MTSMALDTGPTLVTIEPDKYRLIGILSDSHGPIDRRVLGHLRSCDLLVHAGDLGSAEVLNNSVTDRPVLAVRGNNDIPEKWPDEDEAALKALPECLHVNLGLTKLVVVHGHQFPNAKTRHQKMRKIWPNASAIIYGHSHRMLIDQDLEPWVLNPGACGRARTFGGPSCLILQLREGSPVVSEMRFDKV